MSNQPTNNSSNSTTSYSTNSTETSSIYGSLPACTENLTPWTTILTLTLLYFIAILWFCKHGKNVCHPTPDSIFPYIERLRFLRRGTRIFKNFFQENLQPSTIFSLTTCKLIN
ncbi:unnamed protein product [Meloidogyne enterolobii]|uniref:Uncharacterized protein n=1 Tax=Meloidogyne enterolobii TaxID=390850 RepID=A0ACB0XR92_MELEN